jgi:hypothetical protein
MSLDGVAPPSVAIGLVVLSFVHDRRSKGGQPSQDPKIRGRGRFLDREIQNFRLFFL